MTNEKWELVKLGDVVEFLDKQRKPLKSNERSVMQGEFPYYGASGIIDYIDSYLFDEDLLLLSEDGANIIDRNFRVAFIAKGKYWVNNHVHVMRMKDGYDINFICEYLENLDYTKYNTGTVQPKLNQETCKKIMLRIPPLPEQQRIASILSAADKAIEEAGIAVEESERIKSGLMQELMSGHVRIKDKFGASFPPWKEDKLEKIAPLQRGFDLPSSAIQQGEYPVVYSNGTIAYHNEYKCDGYGVITGRSGSIGKFMFIDNQKYWPHNTTLWVTDFCGNDPRFIYYFYQSINIEKFGSGTSVPTLDRKNVHKQIVKVPSSIEEQKKIAFILKKADEQINLSKKRKAILEKMKQGLMQTLLSNT